MKNFFIVVLCLWAVSVNAAKLDPFSVYSANAPKDCLDKSVGKEPLSLPQVIQIGICNNPVLNRDFMDVRKSEAALGKSKSAYLPTVSGNAGASVNNFKEQDDANRESNDYSANVVLNWLLFDFGGRSATAEQTANYLEVAQFAYNSTLQDTVLSITQEYYNLLGAEESLKSNISSEASYKKSYEESSQRYQLGLVALSDKLLAETAYLQSKLAVTKSENDLKLARGALATLLNLPPTTEIKLKLPPKDDDIIKLKEDKSVEEFIEIALQNRSEVLGQESALAAAKKGIIIAKSAALPDISLTGEMGYDDSFKEHNKYNFNTGAGVRLSIPLFTGFSDTYNIAQSKFNYEQQMLELTATKDQVQNEVWSAFQNYKTALISLDISRRVEKSAIETERVTFASYQVGKSSILDLLTAQSNLAGAKEETIIAFYAVLTTKANLYRTIGRF